jgi:pyrroloquinoline quinone biosynthesis protein B
VRVLVLGSAAGGGYPQWNCACPVCRAARDPGVPATPRTQSSIAVRGADGPWILVNASPDLRQQLTLLPADSAGAVRATPVGGVVLTDAEIDHTAGLLLLRESNVAIRVYSSDEVRRALTDHYPLLPMLDHYCGTSWIELEAGVRTQLGGSSLELDPFPTGGDAPLYVGGGAAGPASLGLTIRDRANGSVLTYAPGLAELDEEACKRFDASDCSLVDGTFWTNDELAASGIAKRDARTMGHAPLSGEGGTLVRLSALRTRTVLVHVNNTNPILLDDSDERSLVEASGVEVAYDGMVLEL